MRRNTFLGTAIRVFSAFAYIIAAAAFCSADSAGDVKKSLFQDAEKVMTEADSQETRFYAPKIFNDALSEYKSAESDYERGKTIREITEKLAKATAMFRQAMDVSREGATLLGHAEEARMAARKVMAPKYRNDEWNRAEEMMKRAVSKLEKGSRDDAKTLADEAEQLFRQVERDTVAFSYMIEIREKLRQIEAMKKGEYFAPKSYQKAISLADQAEKELVQQPYGNDKAKQLIQEAMDQADFGLKISEQIKVLVKDKKTFEDLYLESIIPVDAMEKKGDKT